MTLTLRTFPAQKENVVEARACGRKREDGTWEGWIEFDLEDGAVIRSPRETTQPNYVDLEYWANGLASVYLEGALKRAVEALRPATHADPLPPPAFDGPAPPRQTASTTGEPEAILDPYAVYEHGPEFLRQKLAALRAWHLRQIILAYSLVDETTTNLDLLSERELLELIVGRVTTNSEAA